jgi:hypothetical protein
MKTKIKKGDAVRFRNIKAIKSHYRGREGVVTKISHKLPHTCAMRVGNAPFETSFHPSDVIKIDGPKEVKQKCVKALKSIVAFKKRKNGISSILDHMDDDNCWGARVAVEDADLTEADGIQKLYEALDQIPHTIDDERSAPLKRRLYDSDILEMVVEIAEEALK